MTVSNASIVAALRTLVAYTQLEDGQSQSFRTRAYEKAIDAITSRGEPVGDLSLAELKAIEGIGDSTARKIIEFRDTGAIGKVERLRERFPASMLELMRIPGLGPKTVLALQQHLGVTDVAGLRAAIEQQQLRGLPGLGVKSEEKIAASIALLGLHSDDTRTPIYDAMGIASRVMSELEGSGVVRRVAYAGSLRRLEETIGDVDVLVDSADPSEVIGTFTSLPGVTTVLGSGTTKASVVMDDVMQVDLRVVREDEFGAALLYFTGSRSHNIELRQRSLARGLTLNEYALSDTSDGAIVASRTEEDIYRALDLPWIPPEVREGTGEVGAADDGRLPSPIDPSIIVGDLHVHTTWSGDGRSTMTEMLDAAVARGLDYVAITDHGEDLVMNGLSRDEVRAEAVEIEEQRGRLPQLTILHGVELNIGIDGSVDYDEAFLSIFDFGVASIHSHFDLPEAEQTERLLRAIANPAVHVIGHPSGRKIGHRPGVVFNASAVFEAASEAGTAMEINCHLQRLDLSAPMIRQAMQVDGLMFSIATDAHHTSELANMRWGVAQGCKGWATPDRILNALDVDTLAARLAGKREL